MKKTYITPELHTTEIATANLMNASTSQEEVGFGDGTASGGSWSKGNSWDEEE